MKHNLLVFLNVDMKYTGKQRLLHSQKIVFKELFISRVVK